MVFLAARPLDTNDMWWHLALGAAYAREGPWPEQDPILHTALPGDAIPHEWLFGIGLHALDQTLGFPGLRAAHAAVVAAILALALSIFRRASHSTPLACAATGVFLLLAWFRLFQLRPDLVSILAFLVGYRLLFEPRAPPSWRTVALVVGLFVFWANLHSLFLVGLCLVVAALLGLLLRLGLSLRLSGEDARASSAELVRGFRSWAAVLLPGVGATALNPRGFEQHLHFFTATRDRGIWLILDEWFPFDPLSSTGYASGSVVYASWLATDLLLVGFAVAASWAFWRFWRRPSRETLDDADPVSFGLAAAGIVALLVSVRFLWLGVLPLLFILRVLRCVVAGDPKWGSRAEWAAASIAVLSAVALAGVPAFDRPSLAAGPYLQTNFTPTRQTLSSAVFLSDSGVSGNTFNRYENGGFLGYWLAPRLQMFIDSRTLSAAVLQDYAQINQAGSSSETGTFLELLDRRGVDFFLGAGIPTGPPRQQSAAFTTAHLDEADGWLLVHRSVDQTVHLRNSGRNQRNLQRIAAYYEREGVPFSRSSGLDVELVAHTRPDWAIERQMLPKDYPRLLEQIGSGDPAVRFQAFEALGRAWLLLGRYQRALTFDEQALAIRPEARWVHRRVVYCLLRLDRAGEAVARAAALHARDPAAPLSRRFWEVAQRYQSLREAPAGSTRERRRELSALVHSLPVVASRGGRGGFGSSYAAVPPARLSRVSPSER